MEPTSLGVLEELDSHQRQVAVAAPNKNLDRSVFEKVFFKQYNLWASIAT